MQCITWGKRENTLRKKIVHQKNNPQRFQKIHSDSNKKEKRQEFSRGAKTSAKDKLIPAFTKY